MAEPAGSTMVDQKKESIKYHCKKLAGIAHVKVEYSYGKDRKFLTGFDCDQAADCGIRKSPFSGSFNYTLDCPLYIALVNNLN